ncbi:Tn3 family transposase [Streptomyces sp. NPDC006971]|uniref:Tn3 family transposase n=1 Tax=Streptomyces sp. NPDC006971 TaxID=3154784 RepID=UPI0033FA9ED3
MTLPHPARTTSLAARSYERRRGSARPGGRHRPASWRPRVHPDPACRRKIAWQLNKGESIDSLRRRLHYAREGKVTRRRPEQQNERAWCLTVVTNAVICWHTTYLGPAVDELRRAGREVDAEEPAHVSPARSSAVTHPHHRRPTGLPDLTMRAVNSGTTTTDERTLVTSGTQEWVKPPGVVPNCRSPCPGGFRIPDEAPRDR